MQKKRKLKLKKSSILALEIIGGILVVIIGALIFYNYNISQLEHIGYSRESSKKIFFSFKKDYVLSIGENKTLNAAFESGYYNEDYLDNYSKITYYNHNNLIRNINLLIQKKYSNNEISMILAHGDDKEVSDFVKREKIKYLEEFYSIDYAKLKYYDRYVNYSDLTGEDEETTVMHVNLDLDKEVYQDATLVTEYSIDMVVNKHRQLSKDYEPNDLTKIGKDYTPHDDLKASRVAINAFAEMKKAASKENLGLVINSAYRSYEDQEEICEEYKNLYGQSYVDKYVAKPGFSEHQTGLAFDIGSTSSNIFANSKEYVWIQKHAHEYGFIQRFPKGFEEITGFRNEAWHYRYVGKKIATYIYENNITLDEYFVMFLDK